DCLFIYDSEIVESDKSVRVYAEDQPLYKVLDNLLSNSGLVYKVLGKHILIFKRKDNAPPANTVIAAKDTIKNLIIRGHIYDKENHAAIPFATIGITEENIGTITNSDGYFMLRIPASDAGTSLVVSHLGYLNQRIPVQLINEQQVDLYLDRRVISIQEVIIRYIDPDLIIEKAMLLRKMNNAVDPAYLTAFYREGVQKNNKYVSYSEAVFKVYKSPYDVSEYSDQVKLLKSRKIQSSNPTDTVFLKLKAGVQSALQLDIVKCIPGFLDQTPPVEYTYKYADLVSYNAKDAYAITFVQNADLKKALYTGTVYIEKEGFAILGADFEINPACLDMAAGEFVFKKSPKLIVKLEKINYSVSYMPFHGRYYISHARCDLELKTRLRHHASYDHFNTYLELATCNIDTTDVVKFPKQETLKPGVVFSDQPYNGNDAFWKDFNIITPEAKLNEALSEIIGKVEEIR
ncbi:MAG: carboxypeptidase-like regulatory domain-containing protein, partial [Bacteroidota bacterium]